MTGMSVVRSPSLQLLAQANALFKPRRRISRSGVPLTASTTEEGDPR